MASKLEKALADLHLISGGSSDVQSCWVFLVGKNGVGKSKLVQQLAKSCDSEVSDPSPSTFGYEYSVFRTKDDVRVNVIESSNVTGNVVFTELLKANAQNACLVFAIDCRDLERISALIDELIIPLFELAFSTLSDASLEEYKQYLATLFSDEPVSLADGALTANPGMPIFFVATHGDALATKNDMEWDGILKPMREEGLTYAAGIGVSNSKSLVDVIAACALRKPLPPSLRKKIADRADYFLPPGWDSKDKFGAIENVRYKREGSEEKLFEHEQTEKKQARTLDQFLMEMSFEKQDTAKATPLKSPSSKTSLLKSAPATPTSPRVPEPEIASEGEEGDFLAEFE